MTGQENLNLFYKKTGHNYLYIFIRIFINVYIDFIDKTYTLKNKHKLKLGTC